MSNIKDLQINDNTYEIHLPKSRITDFPTAVSSFTNDAGYLSEHLDISGKVDKVTGKGLSTNDFTNTYKVQLDDYTVATMEEIKNLFHHFVDLVLPTGNLWATTNYGGTLETDKGNYYSFAETEVKDAYNSSTYTKSTLYTSNNSVLSANDDVIKKNWGGTWKMPTKEDFIDLINNTCIKWTTDYMGTNKKGVIFFKLHTGDSKVAITGTSNNISYDTDINSDYNENVDTHIFVPVSGVVDTLPNQIRADLWASTSGGSSSAIALSCYPTYMALTTSPRFHGRPVRGISNQNI